MPAAKARSWIFRSRFRAGAFLRGERPADHRAVRTGNAAALPAARRVARDLCGARLFALRERA